MNNQLQIKQTGTMMLGRGWQVTVMMSLMMLVTMSQAQQIQNQFYSVLAPDTVRPNTNYFVSISVDGTGGDLQVGGMQCFAALSKQLAAANFFSG